MSAADDTVDVAGHIFFHGKSAEIVAGFFCFPDNEGSCFGADSGFSVQGHGDGCGREI